MMPERIQLRRTRGWRKPKRARVVSRGSRWGNPFRVVGSSVIGRPWSAVTARRLDAGVSAYCHDEVLYSSHSHHEDALVHTVELFRMYCAIVRRDRPDEYRTWLAPLLRRDLACWCSPGKPCHADVLLELVNASAS